MRVSRRKAAQTLEQWLLSRGFIVPPLPDPLPAPIRRIGHCSFGTRPGDDHPVPLLFRNFFVHEWPSPSRYDFALVEHFTTNSYGDSFALHYHVRWRGNRILLRFVWGNFNKDLKRAEICRVFNDLPALWPALAADSAHAGPIVVAHDDRRHGVGVRAGVESARWRSGEIARAIVTVQPPS
jgi:hypothetical protein